MKTNSWTTAGQAKDISKFHENILKVLTSYSLGTKYHGKRTSGLTAYFYYQCPSLPAEGRGRAKHLLMSAQDLKKINYTRFAKCRKHFHFSWFIFSDPVGSLIANRILLNQGVVISVAYRIIIHEQLPLPKQGDQSAR